MDAREVISEGFERKLRQLRLIYFVPSSYSEDPTQMISKGVGEESLPPHLNLVEILHYRESVKSSDKWYLSSPRQGVEIYRIAQQMD
jgi:hypothetical protein